jgi:hypothetical protein
MLESINGRASLASTSIVNLMEVEANDTLQFLDVLVTKRGPKLVIKVYQKPTHLHSKSNHPHHMKMESLTVCSVEPKSCQDQKDFNKEIKNIRHDLTFNEYPQESVDSIMKP